MYRVAVICLARAPDLCPHITCSRGLFRCFLDVVTLVHPEALRVILQRLLICLLLLMLLDYRRPTVVLSKVYIADSIYYSYRDALLDGLVTLVP